VNEQRSNCSEDRLRSLLQSDDYLGDENQLAAQHIAECPNCQARLEELAAEPDAWSDARESLLSDNAQNVGQQAAMSGRPWARHLWQHHTAAWNESMSRQLLSPPLHPEMLGRIGRYEVERLIGAGGMGVVFKAFDTELNRPVAVKVLAPFLAGSGAARQRFAREARAAAAVVHEHVVSIHNVETDGESPFLVMHYVAGESLQGRIDREGSLDVCEILRIGMQTAAGLAAAHAQGLVHRDVKPSNILLEKGIERALLTDFGLARASDDASLTHTGYHPGTPQYMSPEQARGDGVDSRSDLFSLGSVIYASTLNLKNKSIFFSIKPFQCRFGHFSNGWNVILQLRKSVIIDRIWQVRIIKQSKQFTVTGSSIHLRLVSCNRITILFKNRVEIFPVIAAVGRKMAISASH